MIINFIKIDNKLLYQIFNNLLWKYVLPDLTI